MAKLRHGYNQLSLETKLSIKDAVYELNNIDKQRLIVFYSYLDSQAKNKFLAHLLNMHSQTSKTTRNYNDMSLLETINYISNDELSQKNSSLCLAQLGKPSCASLKGFEGRSNKDYLDKLIKHAPKDLIVYMENSSPSVDIPPAGSMAGGDGEPPRKPGGGEPGKGHYEDKSPIKKGPNIKFIGVDPDELEDWEIELEKKENAKKRQKKYRDSEAGKKKTRA